MRTAFILQLFPIISGKGLKLVGQLCFGCIPYQNVSA